MSTLYSAPPDLARQHDAPHNHLTVLHEKDTAWPRSFLACIPLTPWAYKRWVWEENPLVSLQRFGIFIWSPFNLEGVREVKDQGWGWGGVGWRRAATSLAPNNPRLSLRNQAEGKKTKTNQTKKNLTSAKKPITSPFLGWAVRRISGVPRAWCSLWRVTRGGCAIMSKASPGGTVGLPKGGWVSLVSVPRSHRGMARLTHVRCHLFK